MANVGRLLVEIAASTATFQADLGKAVSLAETSSKRMGVAFAGLKGLIGGIAGALSVGAFVNLIKGSIDAADHLNDLSQTTGVAVETLGGIGFAAKQSGADLDGVAKAFGKLNLTIAKAADGNEEAGRAFSALGLSLDSIKNASPEQTLGAIADKFQTFADGPNKAAIANALFGKSYQDIIPLLNEGGQSLLENIAYFQKYSGVTKDLAERSDAFNDSVEQMKLLNGAFANTLAAKLLPSMQGLVGLYVDAKESGDGFADTSDRIVEGLKVIAKGATFVISKFLNFGDLLGSLAAQAVALAHLDFAAVGAIGDAREDQRKKFSQDIDKVFKAIDGNGAGSGGRPTRRRPAPGLGGGAGGGAVDDTAKKVLDQQIKAFENSIKDEQDILKDREHFLQVYYQDDQIGIRDYFSRRQSVIDEALQKQIAAYNGEIDALQAFAAKASPKDRIETETKIADVVAKRAKAEQDAAIKGIDLWLDQKKAAEQFQDKIEDIALTIARLSGDTITADLFGFDKANAQFRKRAELQANSVDETEAATGRSALKQLDSLRALTGQFSQLNRAQKDFSGTMEDIAIANSKVNLLQATGQISEIQALSKRSEIARANIGLLEQEAAAYEALARSLPAGDAQNDALRNVQRLRLEIDQLAASTNLLADKFNNIFGDAFADQLVGVLDGTKSVKDAFKDMGKSIVHQMNEIAAAELKTALFGKKGAASGIGDLFAGLFGGGGAEQLSGPVGGGIGDIFGKLFSGFGFAGGGSPPVGKASLVGEHGPELFVPKSAGNIIPNDVLRQRRAERQMPPIIVNVSVQGNVSRSTADQIALKSGAAVQRALGRNG